MNKLMKALLLALAAALVPENEAKGKESHNR